MNRIIKKYFTLLAISVIVFSIGCAGQNSFKAPRDIPDDKNNIPKPESREINIFGDGFDKIVIDKTEKIIDLSLWLRKLTNNPKQAYNIDAFDEVVNSSWYTNRNTLKKMSPSEISKGPNKVDGPYTDDVLTVIRAKVQGVTPGFTVVDKNDETYILKFDPKGYPGLASGAEVISTKLFHAAGYNVAQNYVAYIDPTTLRLRDTVTIPDEKGVDRKMTMDDLNNIFKNVDKDENGRIRVLASKYINGIPIGPFRYEKTRKDDPNDVIPHQHRRELRGLRVMAAWLNHFDTKANNSFDSYVKENGVGYVKHYLMDFGSTLGSISRGPMDNFVGHENWVDPEQIFKKFVSLGLHVREYEKYYEVKYPELGFYTEKLFQPEKYRFIFPNPAFQNMTDRDGFWGAKMVMAFTDEQLEAVVKTGEYKDKDAEVYLLDVLIKRRDIVGKYWFDRMNPLDKFKVVSGSDGDKIVFTDLAVDNNFESSNNTEYKYYLNLNGNNITDTHTTQNKELMLPSGDVLDNTNDEENLLVVTVNTIRKNTNKTSKWVKIFLKYDTSVNKFMLIGINRQD